METLSYTHTHTHTHTPSLEELQLCCVISRQFCFHTGRVEVLALTRVRDEPLGD